MPPLSLQVDPVASFVAFLALLVSIAAWRTSHSALRLAEQDQKSKGALAGAKIEFTGAEPLVVDGRLHGEEPKHGAGSTIFIVHSGSDNLTVDCVRVVVAIGEIARNSQPKKVMQRGEASVPAVRRVELATRTLLRLDTKIDGVKLHPVVAKQFHNQALDGMTELVHPGDR